MIGSHRSGRRGCRRPCHDWRSGRSCSFSCPQSFPVYSLVLLQNADAKLSKRANDELDDGASRLLFQFVEALTQRVLPAFASGTNTAPDTIAVRS
ncbi:protein of unknown function [Pseudorhizobium banfieldiae]|uniref:Uncharacterized protein n=1 Tax=Pseudorhizobium banfieldiae TaxID=1125847 RepID=L0NHE8_9HYPH|nr:protein of unknown function [Pseudorhizobium banfieldiae]